MSLDPSALGKQQLLPRSAQSSSVGAHGPAALLEHMDQLFPGADGAA